MTPTLRAAMALATRAALAALTACKLGGPSGDPEAYVPSPSDASTSTGALDASAEDGSPPPAGEASTQDEPGVLDDGLLDSSGFDDAQASTCSDAASAIAVCDPIHDTGCNPFQQCDVDPSQTTTPAGLCLFYSAADGGACSATVFTETCPARSTCVGGACRTLCACAGDCPAGECCSDTSGPPGFTLCAPCP
jgi:hypothetical protein